MNFFNKLKQTLIKTRQKFSKNLNNDTIENKKINEDFFNKLEELLIMADAGTDTANYIINQLKNNTKTKKLKFQNEAKTELIEIVTNLLKCDETDTITKTKPMVILILGVNGVGKTTTIAKLANFYKQQGKKVVLAAADTFRAAAVEQLKIWAQRIDVEIISKGQDCDPASVVYDAVVYAKKNKFDVIICDTAGRLHNKKNLMLQLQKIIKVAEKGLKNKVQNLIVIDATIGQNSLNQVTEFSKIAKLNGAVLTKLDGTAKGGIAIALTAEKLLPIKFLGTGETILDLQKFHAETFAKALFD